MAGWREHGPPPDRLATRRTCTDASPPIRTEPAARSRPDLPWRVERPSVGRGDRPAFPRASHLPKLGGLTADLVPDADVARLLDEQAADDDRHERHDDRVDQAGEDVAGRREQRRGDEREEPAEPAVPDVVWDRQARVPDAGWEVLDEER